MFRLVNVLFSLVLLFMPFSYAEEPIRIVTEDLPPMNYLEDNKLKGIAVEKVRTVLAELGYSDQNIEVLPWNRAYDIALHEANVVIFSMARFIEREELFNWIGIIEDFDMWAYCKNDDDHDSQHTKEDIKKYTVGLQDYIRPFFNLSSKGYSNIVSIKGYEHGLKMLDSGRMDIIVAPRKVMKMTLKELNYPKDKFIGCLHLEEISTTLYIAMSKNSSSELVNKFKKAWQKHYPND